MAEPIRPTERPRRPGKRAKEENQPGPRGGAATRPERHLGALANARRGGPARGGQALAALLFAAVASQAQGSWTTFPVVKVQGSATIVDANHLRVGDTLVRLARMDAPSDEWCPDCRKKAKEYLEHITEGKTVWCHQLWNEEGPVRIGEAAYAACQLKKRGEPLTRLDRFTANSVNWHMVKSGWAYGFAWIAHSGTLGEAIARDGRKARKARRGMWRYDAKIPDDSRARTRNPAWIPLAGSVQGEAEVLAGDIVRVDGTTLRLAGIVAAKDGWCTGRRNRQCSEGARRMLGSMAQGTRMTCIPVRAPSPGEQLETMCTVRNIERRGPCETKDCWINWQLVAKGHAIARRSWGDLPQAIRPRMARTLAVAEDDAMKRKKGMWRGTLDLDAIVGEVEDRWAAAKDGSNTVTGTGETKSSWHLTVGEERLNLFGIFPAHRTWCKSHRNRLCAHEARQRMAALIDGQTISCVWNPAMYRTKPFRAAICHREGERESLNRQLVREGAAIPVREPNPVNRSRVLHDLIGARDQAKHDRVGLWKGRVRFAKQFEVD